MTIEIFDMPQGDPAWFEARKGLPTASMFSTVMASGKGGGRSLTRDKYLRQLAGEIITKEPMGEGFLSQDMVRGKEVEPEARDYYAFTRRCAPQIVGFIKNGRKGASPDALIDDDGGLEIKCTAPHVQIERLLTNEVPSEYVAQIQGSLWVTGRAWWDFLSYSPKLPPLILRVKPDLEYHAWLSAGVDAFLRELDAMVAKIRSME